MDRMAGKIYGARQNKSMSDLNRRRFLVKTAQVLPLGLIGSQAVLGEEPVVATDCHTHFYDPTRVGGVPWPPSSEKRLYRQVFPSDFAKVAGPCGVGQTLVVEASPLVTDNDWVLNLASKNRNLVGLIGHLDPGSASFETGLARLVANPLFRGIRVSGEDVGKLINTAGLADLKRLAGAGLTLDLNAGIETLSTAGELAKRMPELKMVINHLTNLSIDGKQPPAAWSRAIEAAARHPNIWLKVSGLVEGSGRSDGTAPSDPSYYQPVLDTIWEHFGTKRLIFGSNWPVSELFAPYATVHAIVRGYFEHRGAEALDNVFARNGMVAYGWKTRSRP